MTSLVDRYVFTALRRVPEKQRADIDRELRASIEDAVDARVDAGEPRDAAVEATLLELGDPDRLADRYADRASYLIGPELFPAWRRLMTMLLSMVLPLVVIVLVVLRSLDAPSAGSVIGGMVSSVITVGVHIAFWVTAVFAVLERTGVTAGGLRGGPWSLKNLPRYEPRGLTVTQLGAAIVWPVLMITALVLQQFTFGDEPVLAPANWSFWWPYLIVVMALDALYAVWVYRLGTWTHTVTVVNAALALAFAVPVIWLASTDRFFNPAFFDFGAGADEALRWAGFGVVLTFAVFLVWDIAEVAVRAERLRRGLPLKVPGTGV